VTQTLVDRCFELFGTAAGVLISEPNGTLRVLASSSDELGVVELFEIQALEGPCLDCFRSGVPVIDQDLAGAGARWPRFVSVATDAGYRSVHALPIRLRDEVVGALNLFMDHPNPFDVFDIKMAQAFADAIAITILQARALQDSYSLGEQLQSALNGRVFIEQAKGILAERAHLSVHDSFIKIRNYARGHNRKITDVSQDIVSGAIKLHDLVE
jgi:GAF domain-containing protein